MYDPESQQPVRNSGFGPNAQRWYRYGRAAKLLKTALAPGAGVVTKAIQDAFKTDDKRKRMPRNARVTRRAPKRRKAYRSKRKVRRRLPRRFRRKSKKYFSTKGFKIVDREKYGLSIGASAQRPLGHSAASSFENKFITQYITSGTRQWGAIDDASSYSQHVYGRLSCKLGDFLSSGISSYFQKFKIKKVTMKFNFPDQAANTTNSAHPLKMFVNYGHMYKAAWAGAIGYTASQATNPQDLLETPGWKEYDCKRMNSVTISFRPTYADTDETRDGTGSVDIPHMKKSKYFENHISSNIRHWGPTICFRMPEPAGGYGTETITPSAAQVFAMSTFLDYTTVDVTAVIAFKDRNEDADN